MFLFHGKPFPETEFYFELCFLLKPRLFKKNQTIALIGNQVEELFLFYEGQIETYLDIQDLRIKRYFEDGYIAGFYEGLSN